MRMRKKFVVKFFDTTLKRVREFTGESLNILKNIKDYPGRLFSGWFNEAGNCVEGGSEEWLNTEWKIEAHGIYGHRFVTDPKKERRFVSRDRHGDSGGVEFILLLITKFADWSDFDQRASCFEKEYRIPY